MKLDTSGGMFTQVNAFVLINESEEDWARLERENTTDVKKAQPAKAY
jgi:hypothetical protein